MKFLYYNNQKNPIRRTTSTTTKSNESRIEELKKRFRRSGSLGVPFLPEEETFELKAYKFEHDKPIIMIMMMLQQELKKQLTIAEAEEEQDLGDNLVTIIVRTSKGANDMMKMLAAIPVRCCRFLFENVVFVLSFSKKIKPLILEKKLFF